MTYPSLQIVNGIIAGRLMAKIPIKTKFPISRSLTFRFIGKNPFALSFYFLSKHITI